MNTMKSKCISAFVLFLALAATAGAQTPWHTIDSLVQRRAYSDAYGLSRQNYAQALEQGDSYNLLRAAYSMYEAGKKLDIGLNEESLLRHTLPRLAPTERALCHTMLASIYANMLSRRNRQNDLKTEEQLCLSASAIDTVFSKWCRTRLADSIASHTLAALAESPSLRSRRLADYDYLTMHDTLSDYASLTLYEAVVYAALHDVVNDSLLFTSTYGLSYSDSLFRALCDPLALAAMHLPQGSTTLWKLGLLQEVSQLLISNAHPGRPDTTSASWQLLRSELKHFLTHFSPAWNPTNYYPSIPFSPARHVEISSVVAPGDGCYFTFRGDTSATLYLRILPSIGSFIDTVNFFQRLRYALSQPALQSFTVQLVPKKQRYSLPALPIGEYSLLVSDKPFPTSLEVPDSCLPPVEHLSFSCQSAVIESISGSQGFVLEPYSGQPLTDLPVTLRGEVCYKGNSKYDSITLTVRTDSMGRYNFRPLLPTSGIRSPVLSVTHQGHTYTHQHGGNAFGEYQYYPIEKEHEADTLLTFLLSAPVYRYEDTVRFTVMAQREQHLKDKTSPAVPLPHCDINLQLREAYKAKNLISLKLTTDDMGWAEGQIVLSEVLDKETQYGYMTFGAWENDDIKGSAQFAVRDYTLPTLALSLRSLADTHRYGTAVDIAGTLTSRNGATVAPATVAYTLTQWFGFAPWTKDVGSTHAGTSFILDSGELPVQSDGSFRYAFTPVKYEDLPYLDGEYAIYRMEVTATDPAGENVTEGINVAVGDYTGSMKLTCNLSGSLTFRWADWYVGLKDVQASCNNLDGASPVALAVPAKLTIETDERDATLVWQGEVQLPPKSTPLSELIPDMELPDGHLRFILSSSNPRIHPDTLWVSHLGPHASVPLDSLPLFASVEQENYLVGDTLRVRVGSAKKVSALLIVSQGDSLQLLRRLDLDGGFTHIAFPITEELVGTIGISVLAYYQGKRISGEDMVMARRPLPQLQLHWLEPEGFNLTPASPDFHLQRLFAGTPTHWRLRITDTLGNPMQAAVALTAYDNALDQLPDIKLKTIFSRSNHLELYNPYCSFSYSYCSNSQYLTPLVGLKDVQTPFFTLRSHENYRYQLEEPLYKDLPRLSTLLSVGTPGYVVLHCAAEIEEDGDTSSWDKLDDLELPGGMLRSDLSPYGPWFGNLHSDRDGIVDLRFNAPQRLARWQFDGLAMDKLGTFQPIHNSYITYRDIMLQPNVPPFLYTGDRTTFPVRIDRMDTGATERVTVRHYGSRKAQGRHAEALSSPESPLVQFPLHAPRSLRAFAPQQIDYAFTVSFPQHKETVLDAQAGSIPLLPKPRLKGNAYPLTQADYHTLQSRSERFFRWWRFRPYCVDDLFDSLYIAAAFHNKPAVDTLLQMIEQTQLPGGGWPSLVGETHVFSESSTLLHILRIIRQLQQECPHIEIPATFNIQRTLQQADSLMYEYHSTFPQSTTYSNFWLTAHDYFTQYPLDTAYYPMRDSLYAVLKRKSPDQWVILTIYRHGDTALARQLAQRIVQASVYDTLHSERGRQWKAVDNSPDCLLNYIAVFEEVLHDTLLAEQVRQRIRHLAPTMIWYNTGKARLAAHGFLNHPDYASVRREANITLSRQLIPIKNDENSPFGQYTIRLTITLDRPMSHLYLRSPHAACFTSHGELHIFSASEDKTKFISHKALDAQLGSVATQFAGPSNCLDIYIQHLPTGTHTVEYTVNANRAGLFHLPAASAQCLATPWSEAKKGVLQAATPAETISR